MTRASGLTRIRAGNQGTSLSATRMTSAHSRNGAGSNPRWCGWLVGKLTWVGLNSTTGRARALRECHQGLHRGRIPADAGGDQERRLGGGEEIGRLLHQAGSACNRPRRSARWVRREPESRLRLGQDLARQGEVGDPLGIARRHGQGPVHDTLQLHEVPQLVVPLQELANQSGLIEGLLRPVDVQIPRSQNARLDEGRAACRHEERDVGAGGVDQGAGAVGRPDDGVGHHNLRSPRAHRHPVRHAHGHELVRYRNRPRPILAFRRELCEGVHQGAEVRTRIAEEILKASGAEEFQVRLCRGFYRDGYLATVAHSLPPIIRNVSPQEAQDAQGFPEDCGS